MHRKIRGHWAEKMAQESSGLAITGSHVQSPESLFHIHKQADSMIPTCFLGSGEESGPLGLTGQHSLLGDFKASERLCFKNKNKKIVDGP